jgi:molybdenum cofactor cytidylyltransferase
LVVGASATVDRNDIIPAAIVAAGGNVERLGMPVDPGNLLVLGYIGHRAIVGLPGCARSPKRNGFDWVLERLAAGLRVDSAMIAAMGSGGLLPETARPEPRSRRA